MIHLKKREKLSIAMALQGSHLSVVWEAKMNAT